MLERPMRARSWCVLTLVVVCLWPRFGRAVPPGPEPDRMGQAFAAGDLVVVGRLENIGKARGAPEAPDYEVHDLRFRVLEVLSGSLRDFACPDARTLTVDVWVPRGGGQRALARKVRGPVRTGTAYLVIAGYFFEGTLPGHVERATPARLRKAREAAKRRREAPHLTQIGLPISLAHEAMKKGFCWPAPLVYRESHPRARRHSRENGTGIIAGAG